MTNIKRLHVVHNNNQCHIYQEIDIFHFDNIETVLFRLTRYPVKLSAEQDVVNHALIQMARGEVYYHEVELPLPYKKMRVL